MKGKIYKKLQTFLRNSLCGSFINLIKNTKSNLIKIKSILNIGYSYNTMNMN